MAADMEASMFSMFNMRVHVCVCMGACMGHPLTHPYPPPLPSTHPPPPRGVDPQNHLKFDNTSTYQDISIPFEDLKSVKNSPPMGGCVVWWVGGWVGWWVGSGQITKNLKIVDWINIIQLFEDLWFVETLPPMGGCGWMGGSMGGVRSND